MNKSFTISEVITARINKLLAERKWTLYKLAQESGVLYGTLKNIASSQNKGLNFGTVAQIANGFGMTISEFTADPVFNWNNFKAN